MTEQGRVSSFEEFLQGSCVLQLTGPTGIPASVEAIVDTGFSGAVLLPQSMIDQLELHPSGSRDGVLAVGSTFRFQAYEVELDWQGNVLTVEVVSAGGNPLVGMALFRGSELRMMVEDGGMIEITPFDEL